MSTLVVASKSRTSQDTFFMQQNLPVSLKGSNAHTHLSTSLQRRGFNAALGIASLNTSNDTIEVEEPND
jgi:hypothetical protein